MRSCVRKTSAPSLKLRRAIYSIYRTLTATRSNTLCLQRQFRYKNFNGTIFCYGYWDRTEKSLNVQLPKKCAVSMAWSNWCRQKIIFTVDQNYFSSILNLKLATPFFCIRYLFLNQQNKSARKIFLIDQLHLWKCD